MTHDPMTPEEIEQMRRDMDAGSLGPWEPQYDLDRYGWGLETLGESTYEGIGVSGGEPVAITGVNVSCGYDNLVAANARRISRVPRLETGYLAKHDECEALKAEVLRLREALARYACECDPAPAADCAGGDLADCGYRARAALNREAGQ